jgi:hypothetical protein
MVEKGKIGGAMRILAGCLIVAAASFGLSPSSRELHRERKALRAAVFCRS